MRNWQGGVTAVGWLVLLTPFAIVGYAGIRLTPVYLNYMKVVRAVENAASSARSGADATSLRTAIDRHFEIDMVDFPTAKDMQIRREGPAWVIEAKYDDEAPLFGNVSLHVTFDKVVRAGGGPAE
jgi:hypothetical protein